jgi:hypothetical protein
MQVRIEPSWNLVALAGGLATIGGGAWGLGAGRAPPWEDVLRYGGGFLFWAGALTFALSFIRVEVAGEVLLPKWNQAAVEDALRAAAPDAAVWLLQTSFPVMNQLITTLHSLLVDGGKRFHLRILMANPTSENGKHVIAARMRLREQAPAAHEIEIESQIDQFIKMKTDVDAERGHGVGVGPLDMEIRLYDHLAYGPQVHVGEDVAFVGFFFATCSSVNAPMLQVTKGNREALQQFRKDFEKSWARSVPRYPAPAAQPR